MCEELSTEQQDPEARPRGSQAPKQRRECCGAHRRMAAPQEDPCQLLLAPSLRDPPYRPTSQEGDAREHSAKLSRNLRCAAAHLFGLTLGYPGPKASLTPAQSLEGHAQRLMSLRHHQKAEACLGPKVTFMAHL